MFNLLDNAREHLRGAIEAWVRRAGASVLVVVRDHGDGVPPAERAAVFARLTRLAVHRHGDPGWARPAPRRAIAARHGGAPA